MTRKAYAVVENNIVINKAVVDTAEQPFKIPSNWIESDANKGDLYDGSVFTTPDFVETIPESITRYQAMVSLRRATKRAVLKTFLAKPGNGEAKDAFEHLERFDRGSDFIAVLGAAAGFTDAQIDQWFIAAAKIG